MADLQRHGDAEWPEAWCFYIRGDIATQELKVLPNRVTCGEGVTNAKGLLTYRCSCGANFTREPGFLNDEARAWVAEHREHLAPA